AVEQFLGAAVDRQELDPQHAKDAGKIMKQSLSVFNYENVGGIPFLGVDGVSMVGHGGSTPLAIKNMIFNAVKCVDNSINEKIVASLNS
ncbi:MAG: phosphate acyltransferase PlsX, partial [Balneolaceae bacterium]|nr:phosphate acyltransferase PlsX [Balneolaceae bacterium]